MTTLTKTDRSFFSKCALLAPGLVLLALIGCGGDDGVEVVGDPLGDPVYAVPGPYPVGVVTLELEDRLVDVFYPGSPGSEAGRTHATYNQADPLPPALRAILAQIPRDLSYEMRAYRDLPAAADGGPFPVLLFSHGLGGWRLVHSSLASGIASWGFVVAAPDHLERGLGSVVVGQPMPSADKDREVLLASLALVEAENARSGSRLFGLVDAEHVGAAGHSAGGVVLSLAANPAIDALIGYAPVPVESTTSKPTLLIAAADDFAITPESVAELYAELPAPKRNVVIAQTGHNSFTDTCAAIRSGTALTQLARDLMFPIDEDLLRLAENGCSDADLAPEEMWDIVQHFTVAHLRHAFGINSSPIGLGDGVADEFVVPVTYQHAP